MTLASLFRDPPPEFAFEITAEGIAMSRTRPPASVQYQPLAPGVLTPSPLKENMGDPAAFAAAVARLAPTGSARGRRTAALILPDNALRIAVLDFESIPSKEEERQSLIRFRLRKTLPFDVDEAAFSYHVQSGNKVVAAVAPAEVVARYEAPFRAVGLHPGFVTSSSLALMELLPVTGFFLAAHRGPGALSLLAVKNGELILARSLELAAEAEVFEDLYPTLIYLEDQTGARPEKLILVGKFGDPSDISRELGIAAEKMPVDYPGLTGYLASLDVRKAAA